MPTDEERDEAEAIRYRNAINTIREHGLQGFLDFLCERQELPHRQLFVRLCCSYDDIEWEPISAEGIGEHLFAKFFQIDLDAVDRYRQRLLDELSKKAIEAAQGEP